jgi:heme A synthase
MKNQRFAVYTWGVLFYTIGVVLLTAYVQAVCHSNGLLCHLTAPISPVANLSLLEWAYHISAAGALLLTGALLVWSRRVYERGAAVRRVAWLAMGFAILDVLTGARAMQVAQMDTYVSTTHMLWMLLDLSTTLLLVANLALCAWWAAGNAIMQTRPDGLISIAMGSVFVLLLLVSASGSIATPDSARFATVTVAASLQADVHTMFQVLNRMGDLHPVLAMLMSIYVAGVAWLMYHHTQTSTTRRLAVLVTVFIILEIVVGVLNLTLLTPIALQLLHLLLHTLLWITLTLLASEALAWPLSHYDLEHITAPAAFGGQPGYVGAITPSPHPHSLTYARPRGKSDSAYAPRPNGSHPGRRHSVALGGRE